MTLKEKYGSDYFHGVGSNYPTAGYESTSLMHFQGYVDFVLSLSGYNIKWLDVGCAYGVLVNYAYKAGIDAYGVDVSNYAVRKGRKIFPEISDRLLVCGVENLLELFDKESLDVISLLEVLEHLHYPKQSLTLVSQVVKKGGYLLITTPVLKSTQDKDETHVNIRSLKYWTQTLKELGFSVKAPYFLVNPQHNKRSLIKFLTKISFIADLYRKIAGNIILKRMNWLQIFAVKK